MLFKRVALATTAATIIGGSFWMSSDDKDKTNDAPLTAEIASDATTGGGAALGINGLPRPMLAADATPVGPKAISSGELFHFQITKDWVLSRWSYVTTIPVDDDLHGYRVPVVTGTKPEDLAGSLTYYFDKSDQLQRIVFSGATAEPRPIVWQLTRQFGFQKSDTAPTGTQLYQVNWNGEAVSQMKVRPADVMLADGSYARYQVEVTLSRPPQSIFFPDKQQARGRPLKM